MQQKKLSFGEKVAYGFGDVGCNVLWALTASVTTYFYTNVMGISAATVGIVLLLSRCFDGFSDAIIGILVDRTKSKHGKARAWVLWMIAPFGLACILLFMVPANATEIVKAVYVFLTYNFTVTVVYTALNLPYGTMASLMTRDKDERATLNLFRMTMAPVGQVVVSALTMPLVNRLGGTQKAWIMLSVGYALAGMIMVAICFLGCHERENPLVAANEPAPPLKKSIGAVFQNKYWIIVAFIFIMWGVYVAIDGTMVAYYAQYQLGNNEYMGTLNATEKAAQILSIFVTAPFLHRFGKRKVAMAGSLFFLVGAVLMVMNPFSIPMLAVGNVIRGIGGGAFGLLVYSMLADTIEYGHWYTGVRNEGLLYCASSIGYKVGGGLTNAIIGFVMDASGFDGTLAEIPGSAHDVISTLYLVVPIFVYALIFIGCYFDKLDNIYDDVVSQLEQGKLHERVKKQMASSK